MIYEPHPYQAHATQKILDDPNCALFLDMGLGKTVATLTAISELLDRCEVRKILVIAPLRVAQDTWPRETVKWDHLTHLRISKVLGSAQERKHALRMPADIYIINRENVVWLIDYLGAQWDFDMLVIDELSSFKSAQAKRFKALRKVRPLVSRVVGLTGTPAPNGYLDLWSEIYLLDQGERLGRTLTAYRSAYFNPGARKGHIVYEWKLKAGSKAAIDRKLGDICVSMTAADWLAMPDRLDNHVYVHMDESIRGIYKQMADHHILPKKDVVGVNAAAVMNKLLQLANGAVYDDVKAVHHIHDLKLDALDEIIEAAGDSTVLVYYSYRHDLSRIKERYPAARELLTAEDIADWNAGHIPLLVAHPASAGHGLNLQDGGHTIVWFGLPWSLELYQQANARLHRQGQTRPVVVHHILTDSTVDEDVVAALHRKDVTQASLMAALAAEVRRLSYDRERIPEQLPRTGV